MASTSRAEPLGLPIYIGFVIGCFLCGVSLGQALFYYRCYRKDRARLKLLVASILVLDLGHTTVLMCDVYSEVILDHNSLARFFRTTPWSFVLATAITFFITLLTQSFYAFRVWIMSGKNKIITASILFLALSQIASGLGIVVDLIVSHGNNMTIFTPLCKDLFIVEKLSSITCDSLIAASVAYFLNKRRAGFQRMHSVINKLVFYSVSVGLWTSLVVLTELILFLEQPRPWAYLSLHMIVTKCHANSLLALLNARVTMRQTEGHVRTHI